MSDEKRRGARAASNLLPYSPDAVGPHNYSAAIEVMDQALALYSKAISREVADAHPDDQRLATLHELYAQCLRTQQKLRPIDGIHVKEVTEHYSAEVRKLRTKS